MAFELNMKLVDFIPDSAGGAMTTFLFPSRIPSRDVM
jgi:hypothetical protein